VKVEHEDDQRVQVIRHDNVAPIDPGGVGFHGGELAMDFRRDRIAGQAGALVLSVEREKVAGVSGGETTATERGVAPARIECSHGFGGETGRLRGGGADATEVCRRRTRGNAKCWRADRR